MTAGCPSNGPSSLKPGAVNTILVSGALITGGLTELGPWLLPFAGYVDAFLYDALNQCPNDPPAMPTFDLTDLGNLVGGILNPNVGITITKIRTVILRWMWQSYCQCNSTGAPPPLPSPVQPPAGTNTPVTTGGVCYQRSDNNTMAAGASSPVDSPVIALPSGATNFSIDTVFTGWSVGEAAGNSCGYWIGWFNSAQQFISISPTTSVTGNGVVVNHADGAIPVGAAFLQTVTSTTLLQNTIGVAGTVKIACGAPVGAQGGTACVPCPDPVTYTILQNIAAAIQSIYAALPAGLRSYAESTVHSNLSGNGSFIIGASTIAVKITLTTVPASLGTLIGNPNALFDVGYVNPIAVEAPIGSFRPIFNPQLFSLPVLTEMIGFSFHPGVVATITELVAGP